MRRIVFFSSGLGSWATAKIVAEKFGTEDLTLLFADTKIEDEDNYRFLNEAADNVGARLAVVRDGRTPWEVFKDERWIGNSRVAPCSHILKQKPCLRWIERHDPDYLATLYVGIDWSETHRLESIRENWSPRPVEAPLTKPPYHDKKSIIEWAKSEGLEPPRLYRMGFAHANCGGFCVRGGQAHFRNLLREMPDRYDHHAKKEQEMRDYLDADQAILTEQTNGEKRPLTLEVLRQRSEAQIDMLDWGGCGCFSSDEP